MWFSGRMLGCKGSQNSWFGSNQSFWYHTHTLQQLRLTILCPWNHLTANWFVSCHRNTASRFRELFLTEVVGYFHSSSFVCNKVYAKIIRPNFMKLGGEVANTYCVNAFLASFKNNGNNTEILKKLNCASHCDGLGLQPIHSSSSCWTCMNHS